MKIHDSNGDCKPDSSKKEQLQTPQELASQLRQLAETFQAMASEATQTGESFDQTERAVFKCVLKMGFLAMQQFVSLPRRRRPWTGCQYGGWQNARPFRETNSH